MFRGLKETIDVAKFRFNKSFHLIGAEEFLKDLFNDKNVIGGFAPLAGLGPGNCTGVKFTHMTSSVLNMSYFDIFNELKICSDDGYIRQDYEEQVEDIMLADKLRKVMLWEDCEEDEDIANYEKIHEDKYQKEFIFKLFQHIVIGGGVCQYEENIGEYLETVKVLYKDLICVAKDPDT